MIRHLYKAFTSQQTTLDLHKTDVLEQASHYKGWILPAQHALAHRYLQEKKRTAYWFQQQGEFPVKPQVFTQRLEQQLIQQQDGWLKTITHGISYLFRNTIFYPLFALILCLGIAYTYHWHKSVQLHNRLAHHLPYYSDLIHKRLQLQHSGTETTLEKLDEKIDEQQAKILTAIPERNQLKAHMQAQLEALRDSTVSTLDILKGFKTINAAFDKQDIPYYLSPKSFTMTCSSLIQGSVQEMLMLKKLEELLSNNQPELCRTTMMTVYKVEEREQLYHQQEELPLFRVRRADKVPAVDNALGVTYRENGLGSLILLDRVKRFTHESVLPALSFQGRKLVIPYWMKGHYDMEESITQNYKKDIQAIYPSHAELNDIKNTVKQLMKNQQKLQQGRLRSSLERKSAGNINSVFGNGLDAISLWLGKQKSKTSQSQTKPLTLKQKNQLKKLNDVILPSIEYHEAYHQLIKTDWPTPSWINNVLKDLDDSGRDHALEELGAYLAQLANTSKGQKIWLTKLLTFSLNAMTRGQPEFYASGIIFNTMNQIYQGRDIKPGFKLTVNEKMEIYKRLSELPSLQLSILAAQSFEFLFKRKVPSLSIKKHSLLPPYQ